MVTITGKGDNLRYSEKTFFLTPKVSDFLSLLGEHFGTLDLAWKDEVTEIWTTANVG